MPTPGDDDIDVDTWRSTLEQERAELVAQAASLDLAFGDIVESAELVATDDEHDPEGHTIAFERQQLAGLLRSARLQLVAVDEALGRLDEGSFGRCIGCGQTIGGARLAALPATGTCITCAT